MQGEIRLKQAATVLSRAIADMGYTSKDLARDVQLSPSSLSEILSGKTKISLQRVVELGFFCGADLFALVSAAAADALVEPGGSNATAPTQARPSVPIAEIQDTLPRDLEAAEAQIAALLLSPDTTDSDRATALALLGHVASFRQQFGLAKLLWNGALASEALDDEWQTNARLSYGEALAREGRLVEARGMFARALDGSMLPWQRAYALFNLNDALVRDAHALESLTARELDTLIAEAAEAESLAESTHQPPLKVEAMGLHGFARVFATVLRHRPAEEGASGFAAIERAIDLASAKSNPIWDEVAIKARIYHVLATGYRYPEEVMQDDHTREALEQLTAATRTKRLPALFREVQAVRRRVHGLSRVTTQIGAAALCLVLQPGLWLKLLGIARTLLLVLIVLSLACSVSLAWPCFNTENQ